MVKARNVFGFLGSIVLARAQRCCKCLDALILDLVPEWFYSSSSEMGMLSSIKEKEVLQVLRTESLACVNINISDGLG